MIEFQRRPVHIAVEERQQARTDGILSGMSVGTPIWNDAYVLSPKTGIGTYVSKHGPGFFTPVFKKMSKMLDTAVAWNLASHTQCSYSIAGRVLSQTHGPFISRLRVFDATL